MASTFKLPQPQQKSVVRRVVAWKVISDDGRLIRLYRPAEAEARFKHSDLWGCTRAPGIVPIFERRGR